MKYKSVWDSWKMSFPQQDYVGSLETVLSETRRAFNEGQNSIFLAVNAPRITRAYIDYKIDNPHKEGTEVLVRDAINLGLSIYENSSNVEEDISNLVKKTKQFGFEDVFRKDLIQKGDATSWVASGPDYSRDAIRRLVSKLQGDILLIALGHGGTGPGMDVFLRYKQAVRSKNSEFYVARCSRNKHKDEEPRLNSKEIDFLQDKGKSREIVVFDEDCYTGKTIERAGHFFSERVFHGKKINLLANRGNSFQLSPYSNLTFVQFVS